MSFASLREALLRGKGVERAFRCHVHGDTTASASVNVLKGLWVCYACGAHGKIGEPVEYRDEDLVKDIAVLLAESKQIYTESWLDQFDAGPIHPYWLTRFTPEACRRFRLGYDHGREKPCYPLRGTGGEVLGVVYRNLDPVGPKYRYPSGVAIREMLFNYTPERRPTVILVEGAMDAVACWEVGHDAFAIYGASLSHAQIRLIERVAPDRVLLAFDADRAGEAAALEAAERFDQRGILTERVRWDGELYKDLAEMPRDTRRKILESVAP